MPEATIRDVARRAQVSVARCRARSTASTTSASRRASASRRRGAGARLCAACRCAQPQPGAHQRDRRRPARSPRRVLLRDRARHGPRGEPPRLSAALSNMHPAASRRRLALRAMRGRVDGLSSWRRISSDEELAAALPRGPSGDPRSTRATSAASIRRSISTMLRARGRSSSISRRSAASASSISPGPAGISTRRSAPRPSRGRVRAHGLDSRSSRAISRRRRARRRSTALLEAGHASTPFSRPTTIWRSARCRPCALPGLRVPEDVAVAGFDDIPLARHLGLTTVRVRIAELGERALARLLASSKARAIGGDEELHAPELVVRARPLSRRRASLIDARPPRSCSSGIVAAAGRRGACLRGARRGARSAPARISTRRSSSAPSAGSGTR